MSYKLLFSFSMHLNNNVRVKLIYFVIYLASLRNSRYTTLNQKAFHDSSNTHILCQNRHAQNHCLGFHMILLPLCEVVFNKVSLEVLISLICNGLYH
jgi:hypothetical protein